MIKNYYETMQYVNSNGLNTRFFTLKKETARQNG